MRSRNKRLWGNWVEFSYLSPCGTWAIFNSLFGTSAQDWTCLKDVCTQLKSASTIMFKETCPTFCKFSRSCIASQKGSIGICIFGIIDVYIYMEYVHLITLLWNMHIFMEYLHFPRVHCWFLTFLCHLFLINEETYVLFSCLQIWEYLKSN